MYSENHICKLHLFIYPILLFTYHVPCLEFIHILSQNKFDYRSLNFSRIFFETLECQTLFSNVCFSSSSSKHIHDFGPVFGHDPALFQFSSVTQSYLTHCSPMDYSMPGFPVHHQLLELTQIYFHKDSDAIQPSHPLSSPSPAFSLSQHQGLFQ